MRKLFGCISSFALIATQAVAADIPLKAPRLAAPPPVYTWTGFYIGANVGANWGSNNNVTHTAVAGPCNPVFAGCFFVPNFSTALAGASTFGLGASNNASLIGGGQIGYNYQFGSWVAGIETDIAGVAGNKNNGGNFAIITAPVAPFPGREAYTATVTTRLNYLGTLRGRVGFLATPSLLVFGTAGLAYGQVQSTTTESVIVVSGVPGLFGSGGGTFSQTRAGWTAGVGLEWMFAPSWSLKGEYLYYDLGSISYNTALTQLCTIPALCGAAPGGLFASTVGTSSFRYTGNVVRFGLNYKFGYAAAPAVYK